MSTIITKNGGIDTMKFCGNCGNQLEDSAKFCGACGTTVQEENVANDANKQSIINKDAVNDTMNGVVDKAKKITNGKIWLIPVVVVGGIFALWLIIFFFVSVVGSGAITQKGAIEDYFTAIEKQSGKKYLSATLSNSVLKAVKESSDMDKDEIIDEFDDMLEDKYDDDIKYKDVMVKFTYDYDREDVKILKRELKDQLDEKVSISDAADLEISYKVWDDEDEIWYRKETIFTVYKSAGNWYVLTNAALEP